MIPFLKKYAVAIVLVWTLGIGLFLAASDSPTTDEGIHVASAYLALKRGEFRFDPEHPYLFKFATAVPLLILNPNLPKEDPQLWNAAYPTTYDSWKESRLWTDHWFYTSGNNAQLMIFLARIPGVLCLMGLCWLIYYLGTLWFSKRIGFFALVFTAFNPNLLAHGHLTNTDIPVALATLGTVWAMWRYYQEPSWKNTWILGLILGLAQVTKFSAATLIPTVVIWLVYCAIRNKQYFQTFKQVLALAFSVWAIIWLAYFMPLYLIEGTAFQIKGPAVLPDIVPIANGLFQKFITIRYVLPVDYVKGLTMVLGGSVNGRAAYLLGVSHGSGFWWYFPVLYLLKTQLAGLLLLAVGAAMAVWNLRKRPLVWTPLTSLLVLVIGVFLAASLVNKLNIGIRHISAVMPFASLAMALALERLSKRFKQGWFVPAVLFAYCVTPFYYFPNFIGYGNIFVYPPSDGYKYYNDSNIDWGQQSSRIGDVVKNQFYGEPLYVNYQWSPYALEYYGVTQRSFDPKNPPKGVLIAVAATQLNWADYSLFKTLTPIAQISNNTFFYRIPE